jgi:hypothetical protein
MGFGPPLHCAEKIGVDDLARVDVQSIGHLAFL